MINVKNEVYKNGYRRRSCTSKTAKIHRFVRFVVYCFITTVLVAFYCACSDEIVHYKSDETVNFCGFRCATTSSWELHAFKVLFHAHRRRFGACGHLRSCDKDGGHTIRSAISENPCYTQIHDSIFYRSGVIADWIFTLRELLLLLFFITPLGQHKLISYTVDNKNNKTKESSS